MPQPSLTHTQASVREFNSHMTPKNEPMKTQQRMPGAYKPQITDLKAAWEAWKAKKKQEEAAKKSLTSEENMIEKLYKSLFDKQQRKPQTSPPARKTNVQGFSGPYSQQQYFSSFGNRGSAEQDPVPAMFNSQPSQVEYPDYRMTESQKKDIVHFMTAEPAMNVGGNAKSSVPAPDFPAMKRPNPRAQYNFAQYAKIPAAPIAPKKPQIFANSQNPFFKSASQRDNVKFAVKQPQPRPAARRMPPQNRNQIQQNRMQTPNEIQQQLQRMRQLYANKRTPQPVVHKPIANNLVANLQNRWPRPDSVEEIVTNRGIVRIQSVIRPLPNANQRNQMQAKPVAKNQVSQYQNPWSLYNRLNTQIANKRGNYKQADSHATSAVTSNTYEGATAPGQKGAGHNYGYGYGYGTGDTLKGGGWGQGFGGGGPGINEKGNHHVPDMNNPKTEWAQGQGWGQGGKGVKQQEQYKPPPPSFFPQQVRQSQAPVRQMGRNAPRVPSVGRQGIVLPKGPSIMNFEPSYRGRIQQGMDNRLSLRGSTPVSSPAYQVKYFMSNNGIGGYENDSARTMRNEIISNAVKDVLKSIEKKKKRTTKED